MQRLPKHYDESRKFVITKINLSNIKCFDDQAVLGDLNVVNLVYGVNGSGKTSISKEIIERSVWDEDWKTSNSIVERE